MPNFVFKYKTLKGKSQVYKETKNGKATFYCFYDKEKIEADSVHGLYVKLKAMGVIIRN